MIDYFSGIFLVPSDVMISLFKAYVLPHIEYCCPVLLGISKSLKRAKTYHAITHLFFNWFRLDGPNYISQSFTPRINNYNL